MSVLRYTQDGEGGRSDLVQEYTRSLKGKMVLSGGASVAGAALGAAISKVDYAALLDVSG